MTKPEQQDVLAVGYTRVSTRDQGDTGHSLEAQRGAIERWCADMDIPAEAVAVYAEIASGKRADNRPELHKAIAHAKRLRVPLVVYSLSRLGRNTREMLELIAELERARVPLSAVKDRLDLGTSVGRLMVRMLLILNEFEREQTGERTRDTLADMKANGRAVSRQPPYGYCERIETGPEGSVTRYWDKEPHEQEIIEIIMQRNAAESGHAETAAYLNKHDLLRRGRPWTRKTVWKVISALQSE